MVCVNTKIAIIGAGNVGSTFAYTCMLQGFASEIALIDVDEEKAQGQALDLNHCLQFSASSRVIAGDSYELVKGARVVIVTAGAAQKPGQNRLDLLAANVNLFKKIIPEIVKNNSDCVLLIVTNPVDVLTYLAYKLSGFDATRVVGSGTVLDTARLRFLLGEEFGVSPKDICAYVLGEHGDSEFIWWSTASLAGISFNVLWENFDSKFKEAILLKTRCAAYDIINQKGATYYAIALVLAKIVKALLLGISRVFTLSTLVPKNLREETDLFLSLPVIVKKDGTYKHIPINFSDDELLSFKKSVSQIEDSIAQVSGFLNSS